MDGPTSLLGTTSETALRLILKEASYPAMVERFMLAMGQLPPPERIVPESAIKLGAQLVQEEVNQEFFPALHAFENSQSAENAAELLDAIADSIYVLCWCAVRFHLPLHEAFLEVQRSNMAKLQPDGTALKNGHGKVQKPAGWTPPNILEIVLRARDEQAGVKYTAGGFRNGA